MFTAHHLSKSFNLQSLFEDTSFSINPGDRVGLVGPNGCGKTTLMRILAGELSPDSGHISRAPTLRLGYLPQGFEPDPSATIGELLGRAAGNPVALEEDLALTAAALAVNPQNVDLETHYDDLLRRIEFAEAGRAAAIVAGFGLDVVPPDFPVQRLSGGQKMRLSLALILLNDPQILLLDEPTNHLDVQMLEWLESWLSRSASGALIISHDRAFLDRTVNRILELDPLRQTVKEYAGNYSAYTQQRQAEIERQWSAYNDQQMEVRRMREDIARAKAQAAYTERQASSIRIGGSEMKNKGFKDFQQSIAKKVAKKAKARETRLEHYIDSDERVERPREARTIKMAFNHTPHLGKTVLQLDDLTVGYAADRPLLAHLSLQVQAGRRIAFTGPNGSGKTTLLRSIAGQIEALEGHINFGATVRLGMMSQDASDLDPQQTAVDVLQPWFPNQTAARQFLAAYQISGDEALKPTAQLSYGQKSRLLLARLVAQSCNVLLLDEPINHLDIPSRASFEEALSRFDGAVLAVVHDRYFIEHFADEVWLVENGGITVQLPVAP